MALKLLGSLESSGGNLHVNGSIKAEGNNTDQYFLEGVRTGVGTTIRIYDNANTAYIDSYNNMAFRANQNGGSGGNFRFTGGNVGIGTISPSNKLHIYGGRLVLDNAANAQSAIQFNSAGSEKIVVYRPSSTEDLRIYTPGAADAFTLTQAGNVGIGATSPLEKLHVVGKINSSNNIVSNSTYTMFTGRSNRTTDDYGGLNKEYFKANLVTPGASTTGEASAHGIADLRFQLANSAGNTNMSDIMTLRSGGNVGIGTTTPGAKLNVVGHSKFNGTNYHSHFNYLGDSSEDTYIRGGKPGAKVYINDSHNSNVLIASGGGNVGIGTTSPGRKLDVRGDAQILSTGSTGLRIVGGTTSEVYMIFGDADDNSMGGFGYNNNTNELSIDVNNSEAIRINSSGNVGIGTTSPGANLEVNAAGANPAILVGRNNGQSSIKASSQGTGSGYLSLDSSGQATIINHYVSDDVWLATGGGSVGIGIANPSEKLEVAGTIQATSAGTATLILRGDSGNSGDTGQLDSTIKMLHDDMNHGILLETRNYAGAQSFEIKSLVSGTETSRFLIDQDGTLKVPAYGAGFLTTDANGDVSVDTTSYVDSSGDTMTGDLTIKRGHGDLTLLTLKQEDTSGDLAEQKSFIDFTFVDSNTNETPQVRIGAEVGNNDGSASSIEEEGMGAFVVYTNNADTGAGAAGTSLAERFRVDRLGNVGIGTDSPSTKLDVNGVITATSGNSTNWNTAYGWGNHGSAGYLTTSSAASTYAPLASPALTGTPTAPTAAAATNTTQLATTAFVSTAIANLADSAPATLDTLNELAAALGDDANFSTTVTNSIATKLPLAGGTLTGGLKITDASQGLLVDSAGHASIRLDRGSTSYDNNILFYTAGSLKWRLWQDGSDDYLYLQDSVNSNNMVVFKKGGNVGIGASDPAAPLDVQPASDYKVTKVGDDRTSHYKFTGSADHTLTLASGSYHSAEVVITAHQTNGGTNNNLYIRGIWTNNHTTHHWHEIENIGGLSGSSFTITNGQSGDTTNSGELEIVHDYTSGSFGQMVVRVTDHYGTHSYTIS